MKFLYFPATPFLRAVWPDVEGKSRFVTEDAKQEEGWSREPRCNEDSVADELHTDEDLFKTKRDLVRDTSGTVCVLKQEAAFLFHSSNDIQMMLWKKIVVGIR